MNPAELVISKFGGVRAAARAVGRDQAAVSRWRKNKRVPHSAWNAVVSASRKRDLRIRYSDLINKSKSKSKSK